MKPETPYTSTELVDLLKQRQGGSSQIMYAKEIGISFQLLSDIYLGKRSVGNQLVLQYLAPEGKKFVRQDVWHLEPK